MRSIVPLASPVLAFTLTVTLSAHAAKGGFAPSSVAGSRDDGAATFQYRQPRNRTANLKGPIPSNDWWSAILVQDEVAAMAAYPLIYGAAIRQYPAEGEGFGIAVTNPGRGAPNAGARLVRSDHTLERWIVDTPVQSSFLVWNDQLARGATMTRAHAYGDWHVVLETADTSGHAMYTTMTSGSPFTYFHFAGGNPRLRLNAAAGLVEYFDAQGRPIMTDVRSTYVGDGLVAAIRHPATGEVSYFGYYSAEGTTWSRDREYLAVTVGGGGDYLVSALLPKPQDYGYFRKHAYAEVKGTEARYTYDDATATVTTELLVTTAPLRVGAGLETTTLQALMPHQYKHLDGAAAVDGSRSYATLRGTLKLFEGNVLRTRLRNHGLLLAFNEPTASPGYNPTDARTWLGWEDYVKDNYDVDTYGGGRTMLRAAQSINVAAALHHPLEKAFVDGLYAEFADWFTYSPGQEKRFWADNLEHHFFSYLPPEEGHWGHLTGWRAGFGSQALNDGHLHYGYWIHAASILALHHPTFVEDYGWAVEELIRHIANPDRNDGRYPHLRAFQPFFGRSFASGYFWPGLRGGNDLESTSEALQAWQAIYHWGQVTGQRQYRDLGLYLYWTERSAVDEYWLDVDRQILHPDYPYSHVGILRDTSYEFTTHWGSDNIEELYGIQLLPLTPATMAPGLDRPTIQRLWQEMTRLHRAARGVDFDTWHGTMLSFQSLVDPEAAVKRFRFGEIAGPPGREYNPIFPHETWSTVYQFLHTMNLLGHPVKTFHADAPSYAVFDKGGKLTFVGFNPTKAPLTIRFYETRTGALVRTIRDIAPGATVYGG